jgi:hypothetical protein
MVGRSNTLLDEIESDALDETKPLTGALRKCVALGGQADSAELRDWATRELQGYPPDGDLPGFRVIPAPIMIEGATHGGIVKNQPIPRSTLPDVVQEKVGEEFHFYSGVGEIEELARSAERADEPAKLQLPRGGDVVRLMNAEIGPGQQILSVYWAVSPVSLRGLCDQIRTSLVQLVAEIRLQLQRAPKFQPRRRRTTRSTSLSTESGLGSMSLLLRRGAARAPRMFQRPPAKRQDFGPPPAGSALQSSGWRRLQLQFSLALKFFDPAAANGRQVKRFIWGPRSRACFH